jgi:hypothetical protein
VQLQHQDRDNDTVGSSKRRDVVLEDTRRWILAELQESMEGNEIYQRDF